MLALAPSARTGVEGNAPALDLLGKSCGASVRPLRENAAYSTNGLHLKQTVRCLENSINARPS
jgi:hypothetical protein